MESPVGIEVVCPECAEVRVDPDSVTVRVCLDDVEWSYWFMCPECGWRAAAATRQGPALEAIAAGSPFESWRLPAEMSEQHAGPAIQIFDLLDLKLDLMQPNLVEALRHGSDGL
jgi:rubredoxin